MNYAIILAGGIGTRAGLHIPKQFVAINGKPLICYTLDKFEQCKSIDRIIIPCVDTFISRLCSYIKEFGYSKPIDIIAGGRTGLESVYNALEIIKDGNDDDIIAIHDGVRPFVDVKTIDDNVSTAERYGNAVAVVDCVETLIHSVDGIRSDKLIPRDCIKRVLTPQSFKLKILRVLFKSREYILSRNDPSAFSLFVNEGNQVFCSPSNEKNFKITFPDDILYFKKMFE